VNEVELNTELIAEYLDQRELYGVAQMTSKWSGWEPTTFLGVPMAVTGRPEVNAELAKIDKPNDLRQAGRELRAMGLPRAEAWDLLQGVVDERLGRRFRHEDLLGAMWDGCGPEDAYPSYLGTDDPKERLRRINAIIDRGPMAGPDVSRL
jgi:hypothetical protein